MPSARVAPGGLWLAWGVAWLAGLMILGASPGTMARADDQAQNEQYQNTVVPALQRYCLRCHGPEKSKGHFNLASYPDLAAVFKDRKNWDRVIESLDAEIMPPDGEDAPNAEQRRQLVQLLESLVSKADCSVPQPGRVTLRRLNRTEYANTVQDLLGVDIHVADELPLDDVGYGFDTIGDVLSMPPLLLEKYLTAAERLAEAAIETPRMVGGSHRSLSARELKGSADEAPGGRRLTSRGELTFTHDFSARGKHRLRVRAYGEQAGPEPARLVVLLDHSTVRTFEVKNVAKSPGVFECELNIAKPGTRTVALGFPNDFYQARKGNLPQLDRNLVICDVELTSGKDEPVYFIRSWTIDEMSGGQKSGQARGLASAGKIEFPFEAAADGRFVLEFNAYGTQAGPDPVRVDVLVDGKAARRVDVRALENDPATYSCMLTLGRGKHNLGIAFINDYYEPDAADPRMRGDRNFYLRSAAISGSSTGGQAGRKNRLLVRRPRNDADWGAAARESLRPFMQRAFRRPVKDDEVERVIGLVDLMHKDGESFEAAMRLAVQALLASPEFLYRVELDPRGKAAPSANATYHALNDYELASRLSYFLWSTMPDDELMRLASKHALQDDKVLEAQVARMLADPRSSRLVENFGGQWLQLRLLRNATPDPRRFPGYSEELRSDMARETELFLTSVLRDNRSVLDLIDSQDVFVNERLARHYGLEGVSGNEFRRVKLPASSPRGGLLTQASILTLTSNPTRTSPVKRGKYVLEQILGTPPPPPPPNVPDLEGDMKGQLTGSLRQRLEQHRANPSCASCHARLDPLGFGFENFDAVGAWRDREGDTPVDASGVLPGGVTFTDVAGLKQYLKTQRGEQFTRTLTEKLMTYGIGRGLEVADHCAVDNIVKAAQADSYRLSRLIREIVLSDPFRKRAYEEPHQP